MSRAFYGNSMIAILSANVSSTTLSASNNSNTSTISASAVGGRETFNYLWEQSGTVCTIAFPSAASTYFTGSGTTGTTTVYCNVIDTITGNTLNTDNCVITWIIVSQNVVISGTVTYNAAAQAYTLTGTPASPAPSGSPTTFTDAGTYIYPTNITSITPGSGYALGTITGSFVINKATISGTAANSSVTYNGAQQSATVITNVLPAAVITSGSFTGSVTASGINATTYTSSITGTGNYQGTVLGGNFTITPASITAMTFTLNGSPFTVAQDGTAGTNYTIAVGSATSAVPGATFSPSSRTESTAGSYTLTSNGTNNYQGSFTSPTLTIKTIQSVVISGNVTYNGGAQAYTLTGTPTSPAPSGSPASFTNAQTYVYPTNITSITPGSGYALGSVTGSFVINKATITAMSFLLNGVAFTSAQTVTAGTNYTISVGSATSAVPGATYSPTTFGPVSTAGSYSLTSSGTGNYQGSFTSPTLTISSTQNVVISGNVTYNGGAQAYTLTGTPASPAPSGSPASFTNAGTYVYPTNITSITPGSGYTLGTVSGSFVINKVTISGTPASPSLVYNGASQSATVISVVQPGGATFTGSVIATGTNAGTYTSSITGSGNYQGTVNGGTFTITRATITAMTFTLNGVAFTTAQSRTAGTSYTINVSSTTPSTATNSPTTTTVSAAGSYSLTSTGTGNWQGSFTSPLLTLTAPAPSGSITEIARNTPTQVVLQATLTNATATGYAWARVSGTTVSIAGSTTRNAQVTAPTNTQPGATTLMRCTISYSGGSVAPTYSVQWGLI
jgi:hypothetical protein